MTGISRGPDRAALAASREALEAVRDGALVLEQSVSDGQDPFSSVPSRDSNVS